MNSDSFSFPGGELEPLQRDLDRALPGGTVNYRSWLMSVFWWDGILPAGVLGIPQMALSLGANRSLAEFLAISMPLLAFFIRIPVGFCRIGDNHCGPILQCCQFVVFFLAAVFLVCLDTLTLISREMNNGRLWANEADLMALVILWSIYILAMLFVLFPGRSPMMDRILPEG